MRNISSCIWLAQTLSGFNSFLYFMKNSGETHLKTLHGPFKHIRCRGQCSRETLLTVASRIGEGDCDMFRRRICTALKAAAFTCLFVFERRVYRSKLRPTRHLDGGSPRHGKQKQRRANYDTLLQRFRADISARCAREFPSFPLEIRQDAKRKQEGNDKPAAAQEAYPLLFMIAAHYHQVI